jgi:hypothetical protein
LSYNDESYEPEPTYDSLEESEGYENLEDHPDVPPPGSYLSSWRPPDDSSKFASSAGYKELLTRAGDDLQVSKYGLARLLGLPFPAVIYSWIKGPRRPSSIYMARLLRLYHLQKDGVVLNELSSIEWKDVSVTKPAPKGPTAIPRVVPKPRLVGGE